MSILEAILEVFSSVGTWIAESVVDLMPIFYDSTSGLTLLGVLAVAGLAFSVVFLILGIIQNFLHFRG